MQMPPALAGLLAGPMATAKPTAQPQSAPQPGQSADVDPNNPDYEGPDDGPFRCDNCTFFAAPSQCSQQTVVKTQGGVVDPGGCCKFFNTLAGSMNVPAQQPGQPNSNMHQYGK